MSNNVRLRVGDRPPVLQGPDWRLVTLVPGVIRPTRFVTPRPYEGRSPSSSARRRRSVKPAWCRSVQKWFVGPAKWWPAAAECRPGL